MTEKLLNELLLTRFTHDIAGGVGAIMNGCELISESINDKDFLQEAIKILNSSAQSVASKLNFFRLAFGTESSNFSPSNAFDVTNKYINTLNGITLQWEPSGEEDYVLIRLMMILCLLSGNIITRGGIISVHQDRVEVSGKTAIVSDKIKSIISGSEDYTPDSLNIVAVLLMLYAKDGGYSIRIEEGQDRIIFWID